MIARLSGTVLEKEETTLVIDVQGVGYRVAVGNTLHDRAQVDTHISVRIYHHITDDHQELYGFEDAHEQKYFELLLTVPSVGARTARNILNIMPPHILEQAVADKDVALFTKVPGVGKRTAERLLVELHEKVAAPTMRQNVSGSIAQEAIQALMSLGYSHAHATEAVRSLPSAIETVEDAVRAALKQSASRT